MTKISELPAGTAPDGTEKIAAVQGGVTVQLSSSQFIAGATIPLGTSGTKTTFTSSLQSDLEVFSFNAGAAFAYMNIGRPSPPAGQLNFITLNGPSSGANGGAGIQADFGGQLGFTIVNYSGYNGGAFDKTTTLASSNGLRFVIGDGSTIPIVNRLVGIWSSDATGDVTGLSSSGTGNVARVASPTFTGTATFANVTASGTVILSAGANLLGASSVFSAAYANRSGDGLYYIGASHSATPDLIFSNNAGTQRASLSDAGAFTAVSFSGLGTSLTGTASGLTAGNVTTNANMTGDATSVGNATTLATVNSNVGTFGSATQSVQFTVNGKGLMTAAANVTITPAIGSVTGLGASVATFLATPSSANLRAALTDETGSGGAVFATTPTISNPKITDISSNNAGFVYVDGSGNLTTNLYVPADYNSFYSQLSLNASGDTAITIALPNGYTRYIISRVQLSRATASLSTATAGLFSATGGGGIAIVATGALSAVTSSAENTAGNSASLTVAATNSFNQATLYFRVGATQAANVDVNVFIRVLP